MARYYQDFVGLNTFIYDSSSYEDSNNIGWGGSIEDYENDNFLSQFATPPTGSGFFNALMSHRGNVYGYPIWRQIRVSNNPLTRAQRRNNIFTYVQEPGPTLLNKQAKYGDTIRLIEPVVSENSPISLIGEVSVYNSNLGIFEKRPVEIKTAFNNETGFFVNKVANEYFNTILDSDEGYEAIKELYLNGGLENDGSILDSFSLLTYKQTVWPKTQYAYLDKTRSRTFYVNTFWRTDRLDRNEENADNGFGVTIPSQSMWPLDARDDFTTRTQPTESQVSSNYVQYDYDIGGKDFDNSSGSPGILQNRYSSFVPGLYNIAAGNGAPQPEDGWPPSTVTASNYITASAEYSRLHTLKNLYSPINPSGPNLGYNEYLRDLPISNGSVVLSWPGNPTGSIFNGRAVWDAPAQSGKQPFYDSYEDFAQELRAKGKGYSVVPEFRISSHVNTYSKKGVTQELKSIFEVSGVLRQDANTENESSFYKIISNSDFLKHFDLIKKDHQGFADEKILTLRCKALKKFLPYEGFYPAQRSVKLAEQFSSSYGKNISANAFPTITDFVDYDNFALKPMLTPLFAPGILFNTIKSGVAVDFPIILAEEMLYNPDADGFPTFNYFDDLGRAKDGLNVTTPVFHEDLNNAMIAQTERVGINTYTSTFSKRIPFEALVEPEQYLANENLTIQEPHPYSLNDIRLETVWDGGGDDLYKKMASNFLAEIPDFFIEDESMKTMVSLEEENPEFGNAISGNYYMMRIKMTKSRAERNKTLGGFFGLQVTPPQDVVSHAADIGGDMQGEFNPALNKSVRETITMYSRPTAFGPPTSGDGGTLEKNGFRFWMGSTWGFNFPYTPPYYHGESWCDLIFYANRTKKYTLDEIMNSASAYPYYTRYWNPSFHDALRDLSGYSGSTVDEKSDYHGYSQSPWKSLMESSANTVGFHTEEYGDRQYAWKDWSDFTVASSNQVLWKAADTTSSADAVDQLSYWRGYGPQSPLHLNSNAMQLDSSVNLFGKGTVKKIYNEELNTTTEVASSDTVRGKTRWIIQPKFETPILNFNKYTAKIEDGSYIYNYTTASFANSQIPRGMWHQYGDIPEQEEGVFLQIEDIPNLWLKGALGISGDVTNIKSLADLVGFSKDPVRLGEVATRKEISECVVAVPFVEKDATRKFFSIPREDIDSCINAVKREVEPGVFVAGGPPKAGDTVYQMVKKMKNYVFPPSMDFVKYKEIDPFAMYIFEFKHTLTKQDLADIWQNLPPEIGTKMEEAEASISHELLAAELLGDGAVIKDGELDKNADGRGIPSNIQWMVFKVKKRAKTNYFDKVIAKKGSTEESSKTKLRGVTNALGGNRDKDITYNWPYDFFSLVELVKIDAEISFANVENDDKGQKSIKKVESKKTRDPSMISKARGKGRIE